MNLDLSQIETVNLTDFEEIIQITSLHSAAQFGFEFD